MDSYNTLFGFLVYFNVVGHYAHLLVALDYVTLDNGQFEELKTNYGTTQISPTFQNKNISHQLYCESLT